MSDNDLLIIPKPESLKLSTYAEEAQRQVEKLLLRPFNVSAPAYHTARMILELYAVEQKSKLKVTDKNLAILVDVCSQIWRVLGPLEDLLYFMSRLRQNGHVSDSDWQHLNGLLAAVDTAKNWMPNFPSGSSIFQ